MRKFILASLVTGAVIAAPMAFTDVGANRADDTIRADNIQDPLQQGQKAPATTVTESLRTDAAGNVISTKTTSTRVNQQGKVIKRKSVETQINPQNQTEIQKRILGEDFQ